MPEIRQDRDSFADRLATLETHACAMWEVERAAIQARIDAAMHEVLASGCH